MGNYYLLKMFKSAALAALATTAAADDLPSEFRWAKKCDWENAPYENYGHFHLLSKPIEKSRDTCLLGMFHVLGLADIDTSLSLDRCEWSYGCISTLAGVDENEDPTDEEGLEYLKKCVEAATEHVPKKGPNPKHLGMACAEAHPNLDGSPFEE